MKRITISVHPDVDTIRNLLRENTGIDMSYVQSRLFRRALDLFPGPSCNVSGHHHTEELQDAVRDSG